jgi:hypothetical protein
VSIKNAGLANGGIMPMTEQHGDSPPYWLVYFTIPSCNGTGARWRSVGRAA